MTLADQLVTDLPVFYDTDDFAVSIIYDPVDEYVEATAIMDTGAGDPREGGIAAFPMGFGADDDHAVAGIPQHAYGADRLPGIVGPDGR